MWRGAILLMVVVCAIVAVLSTVGPVKAYADTPLNYPADVSGYVLDTKGNMVPNAHVLLYFNDPSPRQVADPAFSGDGTGDALGHYGFSGVDLGNYTIRVEIVDTLGNLHNGTATVKKLDDRPVKANVTIDGYVYSPWIAVTPTPTAMPALIETEAAVASPLPAPKDSGTGGISPLYALAASPVFVVGALLFMRHKKRPATNRHKYVDARRSQTSLGAWNANTGRTPGLSEYFLTNAKYSQELEELVQAKIKHHYNDIVMINRVETMSKKYGIEQFIIYSDIRRIKVSMQRGRYV